MSSFSPLLKPRIFWVELEHLYTCLPRISMQQLVLKRLSAQPAKSLFTFTVKDCPFGWRGNSLHTVWSAHQVSANPLHPFPGPIVGTCIFLAASVTGCIRCGRSCAKKTGRIVMDLNSVRNSSCWQASDLNQHHSHPERDSGFHILLVKAQVVPCDLHAPRIQLESQHALAFLHLQLNQPVEQRDVLVFCFFTP